MSFLRPRKDEAKPPPRGGRQSVYATRGLASSGADEDSEWTHLGELGRAVDYSRASGWVPLAEFLQQRS